MRSVSTKEANKKQEANMDGNALPKFAAGSK
jgi:hypothetical protein